MLATSLGGRFNGQIINTQVKLAVCLAATCAVMLVATLFLTPPIR